jgi:hypothetical protein
MITSVDDLDSQRLLLPSTDAISMLKDAHRQISELFAEFSSAKSAAKKGDLAMTICRALHVHMAIEEEIFYPAFLQASDDLVIFDAALCDHGNARRLINEIRRLQSMDDVANAKMHLLSDMIAQHIDEEECAGGMFSEAEESDMNLKFLEHQLHVRQRQLEQEWIRNPMRA